MKDRIKAIRAAHGLNQSEMAERIGVTVASISAYETGIRVPSNTTITVICQEFEIREDWLRTGEGPMMQETPKTIVEELVKRYNLTGDAVRILNIIAQAFQRLTPEQAHDMVEIARRELLAIDDPDAARDVSAMREAVHDETSPDEAGHESHGS